jgi:hypothetical protein
MNQENGKLGSVAIVDAIEDDAEQNNRGGKFYDAENPLLQPAKQTDVTRKKSWKRKLIGWSFILLLIGGGVVGLYLLVRVKRVNVTVQADSRRDAQNAKPKADAASSENGLTADAINIARAATGADATAANTANPSASPGASPTPTPGANLERKLSFTGNSPVFEQLNNAVDTGSSSDNANPQTNSTAAQSKAEGLSVAEPQSRANNTQSLFVDDAVPKANLQSAAPVQPRADKRSASIATMKTPPPVLPPFGTMLPVRTQGVIFTLRNNSYARLELIRDATGSGWSLPKGTVLVGRTTGSEYDRAFVNVVGYIDPRDNKLVKLTGDVLGSDGAAGIPGKRMGVDRNRLKETLRKVASSGLQVAGTMAGALTGRGTVVIDGAGNRVLNPISDEARGLIGSSDKKAFVKVEAGQPAYVMVADLPKSLQGVDAPGEDELSRAAVSLTGSLTDREVMELILLGTPEEIRAAMPLMTEEQKRLVLKTLSPENDKQ